MDINSVEVSRTGGFAGMTLRSVVNVSALTPQEAAQLQQLVAAAHFFALPQSAAPTQGADRFTFTIAVTSSAGTHAVQTDNPAATPGLQDLIAFVNAHARPA